jgi:hypothetical protein
MRLEWLSTPQIVSCVTTSPLAGIQTEMLQRQLDPETKGGSDVLNPIAAVMEQLKKLTTDAAARAERDSPEKLLTRRR